MRHTGVLGQPERHRPNLGGDRRRLNWALDTRVRTRMRAGPEIRIYVERHTADDKTRRCPKRYTTRRTYQILTAASPPAHFRGNVA